MKSAKNDAGAGDRKLLSHQHCVQVLDIGCGAGIDLLLAARKVGLSGRAIGIDMTQAMRALGSAARAGLNNVEEHLADATSLPLSDVPEKEKAFAEILRVLPPGGRLQTGGYRPRCRAGR